MSLPYSYHFTFPDKNKQVSFDNKELIEQKLALFFRPYEDEEGQDSCYKIRSPFLNIIFRIKYEIISATPLKIGTTVFFQSLINISLVFTLIAALFSSFNFVEYFLFSLVVILLFFWINAIIFIHHIKKQYIIALGLQTIFDTTLGEEKSQTDQEEWLNDPERCPACGTKVNENDLFCPECGLRLKQNRFTQNMDTSKYTSPQQKIVYHYKQNQRKK